MFKPLEFLGSEKEVKEIVNTTIETLERDFGLKVTQEVIIPPIIDCFIDSAIYESLQLSKEDIKSEINLFDTLRIVHEIVPSDDGGKELITILTLGRMGMRKLGMEMKGDAEEATNKIANVDIKLLEKISMRAADYLNDRHGLYIRDYQIIFKVAEIFFDELISYIKVNSLADETITIFDQFTIVIDENNKFESIELSSYMKEMIANVYMSVINEIDKLEAEDNAFAESKIK